MKITVFNYDIDKEWRPFNIALNLAKLYPSEYSVKVYSANKLHIAQYGSEKVFDNVIIKYLPNYQKYIPNIWGVLHSKLKRYPQYISSIPTRLTPSDIFMIEDPSPISAIPYVLGKANLKILAWCNLARDPNFSEVGWPWFQIQSYFENLVANNSDFITLNSPFAEKKSFEWTGKPSYHIPWAYYPEKFKKIKYEDVIEIRHRFGIDDRKVVFYPGAGTSEHWCLNMLFSAMQSIYKERNDVVLVAPIKNMKEPWAKSIDYLLGDDLYKMYLASDLCILPKEDNYTQRWCIHTVKFTEALGAGITVITPPLGSAEAIPKDTYFPIKPGNVDEIVKTALFVLNNEQKAKTVGEKGKIYAEAHLSYEKITHEYHKLIKSYLKR